MREMGEKKEIKKRQDERKIKKTIVKNGKGKKLCNKIKKKRKEKRKM